MIKIENMKKRYGDFGLDISLELPSGKVSGLVGKNGAGKTTTIKAILGLIRPDEGKVEVFGKETGKLEEADRQKMGIALSDSSFSNALNIRSIVRVLKNLYTSFDEDRFRDLCARMDLPFDKPVKEFSTGMRAKLKVICALSHDAKLLILDEPTSGLDVQARNDILDIIREDLATDEERSILISSHISSDLEGLCDDLYLIDQGRVVLHENTDVLLENYGVLKVDPETYEKIDKEHIIASKKENFGYSLFTNEKQYYMENHPGIIIENAGIDDLILIMAGEKK
jgi:ABC-2 type transport system ATP-binding protein